MTSHANYLAQQNEHIQQATLLIATTLITHPADRVVPAEGCDHCMTVAVNNRQAVCVLCRSTIEGPRSCGLLISAPNDPPPAVSGVVGHLAALDRVQFEPTPEDKPVFTVIYEEGFGPQLIARGVREFENSGTFTIDEIVGPSQIVEAFINRFSGVESAKGRWVILKTDKAGRRYSDVLLTTVQLQLASGDKRIATHMQFMCSKMEDV